MKWTNVGTIVLSSFIPKWIKHSMPYRAAVIGLGNIGFKFLFDARRTGTWTHVDAYTRCPGTILVGAVEIDPTTIARFKSVFPDKPVYGSVKELFHNASPEIVSIAVPTAFHDRIFFELIEYPVKAIFCEKPMSLLPETSEEMLREAYRKEILVAVNYTRRWQNSYKNVRQMVKEGKIGTLRAIHAFYPGQIYNIGSHLFDTIRMLGDIEPVLISSVRVNEGPDPSLSGWILCKGDVFISFSATGKREDLIFEIDLVGDTGRIRILQNGSVTEYYRFSESTRYSGYRELVSEPIEEPRDNDRFLDAICDIVAVLDSKRPNVCCSGRDGLIADILIAGALRSAAQEGNPVEIKVD